MRQFAVIGLGRFGYNVAKTLSEKGHQVMAVDINEEKVRLRNHCEYFTEKISSPPPNGKILNFISQEIGREINTIGSKANDSSIQKLVVMMKDDLEKIKEQTLNVL